MFTKQGLVPGRVVTRYKRFLADVELEDGTLVTAHCTNTGSMKTCWAPCDPVLLEPSDNPARKLRYTWIACQREGAWIGVDTGIPNKVVLMAARADRIPGLKGLVGARPEVRYGSERSRIDVLAVDQDQREVYIEVKNVTLKVDHWACFPDAATERGTKHLRELQGMVRAGARAAILFFIHRPDVRAFDAARDIDPGYAEELDRAKACGVEVLPVAVAVDAVEEKNGMHSLTWNLTGLMPWIKRS